MRLQSITAAGPAEYVVVTDEGSFLVPHVQGGWALRRPSPYRGVGRALADPHAALVFLGVMKPHPKPLGGCNCIHRR